MDWFLCDIGLHHVRVKRNTQFILLCNPQKSSVNVCVMKILISSVSKKSVCFYKLGVKNLKVAVFVIFPTSIMVLFEIHQRFKGHFLNELRISFNMRLTCQRAFTIINRRFTHPCLVSRCVVKIER